MDLTDASLYCAVNIEWLNVQGISIKKIAYKLANLKLIRNEIKQICVEISTEKNKPIKLEINGIQVHKKFMSEGKASIKFNDKNCTLFLSNAPPGLLINFLKILFIKMSSAATCNSKGAVVSNIGDNKEKISTTIMENTIRKHLLNGAPSKFDEISPITNIELNRAKKIAGLTIGAEEGSSDSKTPTSSLKKPGNSAQNTRNILNDNKVIDNSNKNGKKLVKSLTYHEEKVMIKKESSNNERIVPIETIPLNDEQQQVLNACLNGKNVFFTGSAGTGKSFLLRKIISALPPDGTVATASTGVAACLIGGVTLHSFVGIGDGSANLQRCYGLASRPVVAQTWRKCKRLIIDEISMVDAQFFEKIEAVARYIRRNDKPFGGIQLIICGDFFQLPPITKSSSINNNLHNQSSKSFCFQSKIWSEIMSLSFELKVVHRQKDSEFIKILNHIRIGHVTDAIVDRLMETSKQCVEENGILATQLCSHTNDANIINESKLEKLTGEMKMYQAQDQGDLYLLKQLSDQLPVVERLELKIGAQVMLLKNINISVGLVNGARGVIVKFNTTNGVPIVKFKNNREYEANPEKWIIKTPNGGHLIRKQIPLKLAWAFSIHKSQGLTLDCVEMSLSKVFEAGQAYVALSRAKSLQSIRILDFNAKQVWANPDVLQFYKLFRRQLYDTTYIPLGEKGRGMKRGLLTDDVGLNSDKLNSNANKRKANLSKYSISLLNKPLVNIC